MHRYQDAFLFEAEDEIVSVENKDGFLFIGVKDTIFYPGGGGQPCDTGVIETALFLGEVVEVFKEPEKIIHKLKVKKGSLKKGDKIKLKLNKDSREKLVRMHTGEHVLFKSLEINLGEVELDKINLGEEESSLFIKTKEVTWEKLFKAEELVNKIIKEDRKIIEKEYLKAEAIKLGKLRIKPDKINSNTVRVVEVKDFDWSACAGTHAKSTSYIGSLLITKFNFVKGSWEIRFKTGDNSPLFEFARITRETASILESDTSEIISSIERLQKEANDYKEKFREMSSKLLDFNNEEKIGGIILITNVVEDVEKKQLTDKAVSLLKEKTIVCFVNITEDKAIVLLTASEDLKLNVPELLNKILNKFDGKGGGRDNFAMGAVDNKYKLDIITKVKELIKTI
ncbi:MAG: DHHA1 domain-containing protein [Nanoarchaeota archaeon]